MNSYRDIGIICCYGGRVELEVGIRHRLLLPGDHEAVRTWCDKACSGETRRAGTCCDRVLHVNLTKVKVLCTPFGHVLTIHKIGSTSSSLQSPIAFGIICNCTENCPLIRSLAPTKFLTAWGRSSLLLSCTLVPPPFACSEFANHLFR